MTRRQEPSPRSLSSNPMSLSGRAAIIAIVAASLWSGSASAALLLPPPSSSPTLPISAAGIAMRAASSAVGDGRTTQRNPSCGVASSSSSPSPLPSATTEKRCGFEVGCSVSRVKSLSPLRPGGRGENSYRDPQEEERCRREERSRWLSAVDGSTALASSSRRRCLFEMLAAFTATSLVPTILLSEEALAAAAASDENDEPEECRGGAIVAESAVPGAYQQVCMTLPERKITLKSTCDVLSVLQGTSAGGGTLSGRTGVAVWNSALLLARLLDAAALATMEKSSPSPAGLFQGQTVLELGCGTALASIVASKLGADEVLATDGNGEVVELARTNLERNGVPSSASSEGRGRGQAEELKWGLINAADYYDTADVVLGSDLTYNSGSWRVLAETMAAVLKQDGYVLYLALGHSGFAVRGELGGFLEVAAGEGLEAVEEYSDRWPFQGVSLNKVLDRCVSSKERAVIESTGGVRAVVLRKKAVRKWS